MRGKKAKVRRIKPDQKYNNAIVTRFINKIMVDGKKSIAQRILYEALEAAAKDVNIEVNDFVNVVMTNLRPSLEVKSRRVGGANYQVPVPVSPRRQEALVVRWIVDAARSKSGDDFAKLLKKELVDAYNKQGVAIEKKVSVEKMAEANKAFAHFSW